MKRHSLRITHAPLLALLCVTATPTLFASEIAKPEIYVPICEADDATCLIIKEGAASPSLEGLGKFEFVSVLEDSRCPIDAFCIWEGRVAVELKHTSSIDGSAQKFVIGLGGGLNDSWTDSTSGESLVLKEVWPRISLEDPIDGPYQLKLKIETAKNTGIELDESKFPCQDPLMD